MFWNMVLFLCEEKTGSDQRCDDSQTLFYAALIFRKKKNLLEVEGQICGNDADIEQVLHVLKLTLLQVAEDVQALREGDGEGGGGQNACTPFPFK